jgi:glutamate-1-semialdehyde 2,1-aminomutase
MKGQELYTRAKRLIPGGVQLLSKRPELFLPDNWPAYYARAKGVEITDLDGRSYIDMGMMGIGACVLGYADDEVDAAVRQAISNGVAASLNAPEEVELAEALVSLHPWADMARFARSGGEAMAIAVRIARAFTGRDVVAICGYHGWADWYLAANLGDDGALDGHLMPGLPPAGVPAGLRGTTLAFHYNRLDELKAIARRQGRKLAAIVMEPRRGEAPAPGFLEGVRQIADELGAVLIFDEITSGFRMHYGGVHLTLGTNPDMAVFAKGLANGYAQSAVIGRADVMDAAQATFISSTNWTERVGPAAALATLAKFRREAVIDHLTHIGGLVRAGWTAAAERAGLALTLDGVDCLGGFALDEDDAPALVSLFVQAMLDEGYLAYNQFKPSLAHTPDHVAAYLEAVERAFTLLADAARKGDARARLRGPVARGGFYRLTR